MGAQHEKTQGLAIEALQHVADREEVAQALGHLLVVDVEKTVVQPVIDMAMPERALALGDLVLVMRELQVHAATVDVEALAQQRATHRRALDVPARAARAIVSVETGVTRLVGFGGLPEHKVQRVVLAAGHRDPLASAQLIDALAR